MVEPTETSPLLSTENHNGAESAGESDITSFPEIVTYTPAGDFFPRPIEILTKSILISSALAFILLVTTYIFIDNALYEWTPYSVMELLIFMGGLAAIAFIAALINLRVKVIILFNIFIDVFIVWSLLACFADRGGISYSFPGDHWCQPRWYDKPKPIQPTCLKYVLAAKILMGISLGLAAMVGVTQLVLLLLRCVAAFKSKFWRRPSRFNIPPGELTLQITFKYLRQDLGAVAPPATTSTSQDT